MKTCARATRTRRYKRTEVVRDRQVTPMSSASILARALTKSTAGIAARQMRGLAHVECA